MHGFQIRDIAAHEMGSNISELAMGEHATSPQHRSTGNVCKYLCKQYDSMHVNHSQSYGQLYDPLSEPNTQRIAQESQCWFNDHTGRINNHNLCGDTSTSCDTGDIQSVAELGNVYVICNGNSDVNSDDYYPVDLVNV